MLLYSICIEILRMVCNRLQNLILSLASQDMPVVITFQATRAIPEEQAESKFVCSCLKTAKNMFYLAHTHRQKSYLSPESAQDNQGSKNNSCPKSKFGSNQPGMIDFVPSQLLTPSNNHVPRIKKIFCSPKKALNHGTKFWSVLFHIKQGSVHP